MNKFKIRKCIAIAELQINTVKAMANIAMDHKGFARRSLISLTYYQYRARLAIIKSAAPGQIMATK